ncbi:hypothetical protein ACFYSH_03105 [Streptomyces sp. NPDC005791]|uniref:hypothetical protein n=1 Tax=unclassified Streptomyces TaxID=2593676 RepID=UPI0033C48204
MKQSAVRTLGVIALGAAFAAVGAGSASAAPLPVDPAAAAMPAAVTVDSVAQALPFVEEATFGFLGQQNQQRGSGEVSTPGTNLLGGLPAGGLTAALPFGG